MWSLAAKTAVTSSDRRGRARPRIPPQQTSHPPAVVMVRRCRVRPAPPTTVHPLPRGGPVRGPADVPHVLVTEGQKVTNSLAVLPARHRCPHRQRGHPAPDDHHWQLTGQVQGAVTSLPVRRARDDDAVDRPAAQLPGAVDHPPEIKARHIRDHGGVARFANGVVDGVQRPVGPEEVRARADDLMAREQPETNERASDFG